MPQEETGGPVRRLPHRVADPDAPRDGAGDLPGHARHAGQPARSRGRGREPVVAGGAEEPRRALRPRPATPGAVPDLRRQGAAGRFRHVVNLQDADGARDHRRHVSHLAPARLDGPGARDRRRSDTRHPRRDLPEPLMGLPVGELRDARRRPAEFRPRGLPHHSLLVRDPPLPDGRLGLAARLGASDRGARARADGDHRALHPRLHARGHPGRLHADRARGEGARPAPARSSNCWRDAFRRLRGNRLAMAGGVVIVLLCLVAIFADLLAPLPYTKTNFGRLNEAPSRDFPLGTDQLGRDLLSRMIYGARVSMLVGLGAQVIVVLIGVPVGALSRFLGGRADVFLTRFIDVMYAFPRLLFVILVMSALGAGLTNIFVAIGLTGWVGIARQTRAQVLAIKEKEFVDGARALGAGFGRVLGRHVMPTALTPIIVAVTFGIPEAIFTEAALSFIGVGINPPTPSWGQMVGEGQQYIRSYWHLCVFPSIAIAITMLSFTFFGDGVRDALDPKLK